MGVVFLFVFYLGGVVIRKLVSKNLPVGLLLFRMMCLVGAYVLWEDMSSGWCVLLEGMSSGWCVLLEGMSSGWCVLLEAMSSGWCVLLEGMSYRRTGLT